MTSIIALCLIGDVAVVKRVADKTSNTLVITLHAIGGLALSCDHHCRCRLSCQGQAVAKRDADMTSNILDIALCAFSDLALSHDHHVIIATAQGKVRTLFLVVPTPQHCERHLRLLQVCSPTGWGWNIALQGNIIKANLVLIRLSPISACVQKY
jgi:hypothetical protein